MWNVMFVTMVICKCTNRSRLRHDIKQYKNLCHQISFKKNYPFILHGFFIAKSYMNLIKISGANLKRSGVKHIPILIFTFFKANILYWGKDKIGIKICSWQWKVLVFSKSKSIVHYWINCQMMHLKVLYLGQ